MSKKEEKNKQTPPEMDMNVNPVWDILNGGELPKKNKAEKDKPKKDKPKKKKTSTIDEEIDQFFSEIEETTVLEPEAPILKKKVFNLKDWWFQILLGISSIVIIVFVGLFIFKYDRLTVTTNTMSETIEEKNQIIYQDSLAIKRFNVVVVEKNNKKDLLRVIGMPGDSVKMSGDILTINNSDYDEIYLKRNYLEFKSQDNNLKENYTANFDLTNIDKNQSEIKNIPKNKYLLLGDNRMKATDSREIGFYDASEIEGVVLMKIWPLSDFGPIE